MHEVRVPKLALAMTETQLLEWVAKEGQKIEARQVLVVLESDKATYELEAPHAGILHILTPVEKTIPVNHLIALLAENPEEYEQIKTQVEEKE